MEFEVLQKPLTIEEIKERVKKEDSTYIEVVVEVSLSQLIDNDLDGFLDLMGEKAVGSVLLQDIQYKLVAGHEDVAYIQVSGDVSGIIDFEDDGVDYDDVDNLPDGTILSKQDLLNAGYEEDQVEKIVKLQQELYRPNVKVELSFTSKADDEDLVEWLEDYKGELLVTSFDSIQYMIWLKDCPYGISMDLIDKTYI